MAEFTPGPWAINGKPDDGFSPDINAFSGRGAYGLDVIARLFGDVPKFNGSPEEQWANARLIAAAPDLLTACEWAERALAPFSKEPAEKSGIALLRAAIAKARGD